MRFNDKYLCLMTEAQGGLKLFPAIKVYGKIFIDKNRLGHFNVFREIFEEFLPKRFGKNLTDAQLDSLFEKGNPVEGFAFYHPTTKELHFLSREESHKKFNIHSTEQL